MSKGLPVSVLICVYKNNDTIFLAQAIDSILNQTRKPNDIVIVVDGPISKKLNELLVNYSKKHSKFQILYLPKNVGVGQASNEGITICKNELIAKMDADDISLPNRLELQFSRFQKDPSLVLLGGQMTEFIKSPEQIVASRKVPLNTKAIKKFAACRSPFNNVTVMYKKSIILALGGYPKINRAEDYYLFSKIIAKGHKAANLKDTLVYVRTSQDNLVRRKSWAHTKSAIFVRNEVRKMGLSTNFQFFYTSLAQIFIFLTPQFITKIIYKRLYK